MSEEKQSQHDFATHPWLINFDKKSDKEKILTIVEQLKYLENLIGTISVIMVFSGAILITLMGLSIVTGKFDLGMLTSVLKLIGG